MPKIDSGYVDFRAVKAGHDGASVGSVLSPASKVIVMFDEDEAGRESRAGVLHRLALPSCVRVVAFAEEGFQVKHLTGEAVQLLGVLSP